MALALTTVPTEAASAVRKHCEMHKSRLTAHSYEIHGRGKSGLRANGLFSLHITYVLTFARLDFVSFRKQIIGIEEFDTHNIGMISFRGPEIIMKYLQGF